LALAERRAARLNQIVCYLPSQRLNILFEAFHPLGSVALCIAIQQLVSGRQWRPTEECR
jgi:hypothetical protein